MPKVNFSIGKVFPFCLLKFRGDLEKNKALKDIAAEEKFLISEIDRILEVHKRDGIISVADESLLIQEMFRMHRELYGDYAELSEVDMTLQEKVQTHHKEWYAEGISQGRE